MKYQHDLKVQYLPTGAIKPDPRNARTHSKKQVEQIAASMGAFGSAREEMSAFGASGHGSNGDLAKAPGT